MGIDYCLVFDNDEATHAFEVFKFFPLIVDDLDEFADKQGIGKLGPYLHHDPESEPELQCTPQEGAAIVEGLIDALKKYDKPKFSGLPTEDIVQDLSELHDALKDNANLETKFSIALVY